MMDIAAAIAALAVILAVVGGLCAFIFKGLRSDVQAVSAKVEKTHLKIDGIFPWADNRFRTKETCDERHKHGDTGVHAPVGGD